MSLEIYKNLIIGSGEGGKYLAWHLAQSGQHTVVVERRWVGGPARTSIVFPARTKSGALRLRISCITQPDLGLPSGEPHLTWRRFENGNAIWSRV
jgi:cation diffusion facilitator CzcD-associated flavoprotein CzcO